MAKLQYTDLTSGVYFNMQGEVYEVIDSTFSKKSRQQGSNQVRIRRLDTGAVTSKTLHSSDVFESVDIEKERFVFIYARGDEAWFHKEGNPKERIHIPAQSIPNVELLPEKITVTALVENERILTVRPPIKVDVVVKEAPPNVRGNTAQGGNKHVVVGNGFTISAPLFIETGDVIRVNTETGEYDSRVQKNG